MISQPLKNITLTAAFVVAYFETSQTAQATKASHYSMEQIFRSCKDLPPGNPLNVLQIHANFREIYRREDLRSVLDDFAYFNKQMPSVSLPLPNFKHYTQHLFHNNFYYQLGVVAESIKFSTSFESQETWTSEFVQNRMQQHVWRALENLRQCPTPESAIVIENDGLNPVELAKEIKASASKAEIKLMSVGQNGNFLRVRIKNQGHPAAELLKTIDYLETVTRKLGSASTHNDGCEDSLQ